MSMLQRFLNTISKWKKVWGLSIGRNMFKVRLKRELKPFYYPWRKAGKRKFQ